MEPSFAQTFLQLLPFLVAGAFLPTWTSYVMILLGTDRPFGNAGGYVAGNATWRLVLGVLAIFSVSIVAPQAKPGGVVLPPWLAWSFALVLLGGGVFLFRRKPRVQSDPDQLPAWLQTMKRLPPLASYGYGLWNCLLPGAQWVYFLGGSAIIASSGLPKAEQFVLLLIFVAGLEVMLLTPIAIYARNRERAEARFQRLDVWLGRHATQFFGSILIACGLLFLVIAADGGRFGF